MPTNLPYNSSDYEPPAPELRVAISLPGVQGQSSVEVVRGLCDTGADITCLPSDLVERLGLIEVDEVEVAPYDGPSELKPLYAARLEVEGRQPRIARVVAVNGGGAILGRDLLNLLRLELHGPAGTLVLH